MAKESSFDVVSVVDMQEVDNACQQAVREIAQRYDLKGSGATHRALKEGRVLQNRGSLGVRREPGASTCSPRSSRAVASTSPRSAGQTPRPRAAWPVRQAGTVVQGIDADTAKKISKDIRDLKVKAKATIEGDKLRVSSASKDVLQSVIAALKERDYGQPLQFVNYR